MSESNETIQSHPVAPRLKNGPKTPHLGPDIHAYRTAHAQTVAEDSDEWWAKVCVTDCRIRSSDQSWLSRLHEKPCTGIAPSTMSELEGLEQETSSGSQREA